MRRSIFILTIVIATYSCSAQNMGLSMYNYKAETRGFLHLIQLKASSLSVENNGVKNTFTLTKKQLQSINRLFGKIDLNALKNNLDKEAAAVDREIPATLKIVFNDKEHHFEFSHHNLPEKLKEFNELLLKISKSE